MSNQLVKKNPTEGYQNVFPKTFIDAIKDKESGVSLAEILQGFNMYFLSYNGSRALTRCKVPSIFRKEGLWITYVLYDHTVVTEWYNSDQIDDNSWSMDSNWRVASNNLVGDVSVSADGYWVINGEKTEAKAQGEQGVTPLLRVGANNKLQVSYNAGKAWRDISDYIVPRFRWNQGTGTSAGNVQISMDLGKTWTNLSNEITNNLRISRYIGINESLPTSGIAEGTIYMKGPYYDEGDTSNANPIYRMWVYAWKGDTLAWQDNGEFTSISAGVVQEKGTSTTEVMSQDAVTRELTELESETNANSDVLGLSSNMVVNSFNGFIRSLDNQLVSSQDYNYTQKIRLYKGNNILVNCVASPSVGVLSIINGNDYYVAVKGADGEVTKDYTFTASVDCYVVVSFRNAMPLSIRVNSDVNVIDRTLKEREHERTPQYTTTSQFVRASDGTILDNADYCLTSPIKVLKGDKIIFEGLVGSAVLWVAESDKDGRVSTKGVAGTSSDLPMRFTHEVDHDGYVRISYRKDLFVSLTISANVMEQLKRVDDMVSSLGGYSETLPCIATLKGKFVRASDGAILDNAVFAISQKIDLSKGDTIKVITRASSSSAAIAEVISEGISYKALIVGEGYDVVSTYTYISDAKKDVVVSFAAEYKDTTIVIERASQIDGITEISVGVGKMFSNLIDAIDSLKTNKEYLIKIYEGTYNTIVADRIKSGYRGLIIPNNVSLIGVGDRDNIIIKGELPSAEYAEFANNIATINLTTNGKVENVTIVAKNIRYCNHDDGDESLLPGSMIASSHLFKDVKFIYENVTENVNVAKVCYGAGAQADKEIIFENCIFINNAGGEGIILHDNSGRDEQIRGARMHIRNCQFIMNGSDKSSVWLSNSGGVNDTFVYINNTLLHNGVRIGSIASVTTNRLKLMVSACKNYKLVLTENMVGKDLSADVCAFCNENL